MVRLQKFLADAGICSRRKAEELILQGKISVNGEFIREVGVKVDENYDIVKYKGKIVKINNEKVYIALNKPTGYITSVKDEQGRRTVMELVKSVRVRVFPIGRLDYNTSGLLLLTNDGDLTFKLTHPKHEVGKTYIAKVRGVPTDDELNKLRAGIHLDGTKTAPAEIDILQESENWCKIKVIIHEGKNRQVRRMFEYINHDVIKLKRTSIGKIDVSNLQEGNWRYLDKKEIDYLLNL